MAKFKSKPKDTLTFYRCIKCGNSLTNSEVVLGHNNGLAPENTTCNKCILGIKITTDNNKPFELDRKGFKFGGADYLLIVTADSLFNPVYEISSNDVVLYLSDMEQCLEGIEAYEYLVRENIISPTKKHYD